MLLSALIGISLWAQKPLGQRPDPSAVEPPEEDEGLKPTEYVLNPLQAQKEMRIGDFYFKKKSWKAAAKRYQEATLWDPGYAEAFLKLGETRERMKDSNAARDAYAKYLELVPDSKHAPELQKKIAKVNK